MSARTILSIPATESFWPALESWAARSGFELKEQGNGQRLYQKGKGFLVAPMMLKLTQEGAQLRLEAWVRMNFFVRLQSLFMLPAEMSIESGGFRAVVPRNMARKAINELLASLSLPVIP